MRALLLATVVLVTACSDDPPKKYDSYQLCFDDKRKDDLSATNAIARCCLDHEILDMPAPVCGNTDADCINYLTNNLKQTDADITVQQAGCTKYIAEKNQ